MAKNVEIPGVGTLDLNKIARLLPGRRRWDIINMTTQGKYILAIVKSWDTLLEHGIDTPLRIGHFLGQGLIETGWLRYDVENLNYSAQGLRDTFSFYRRNPELADQHARNPETIANTVYGNRTDLGNDQDGDGWKFRGRGFFQLTGRDNYTRMGGHSGLNLVEDPDLIKRDLTKSVLVACVFWKMNKLSQFADQNDAIKVSRGVNRGDPNDHLTANHEDLRILWTNIALSLTQNPQDFTPSASEDTPSTQLLSLGARGARVKTLQADLLQLGFDPNGVDGVFGRGTKHALVAFQQEHGLVPDGVAGPSSLAAIEKAVADTRTTNAMLDRTLPGAFGPTT